MFEQLGLGDITPRAASVLFALFLGVIFGLLAEPTRFCFRRAVAGPRTERRSAAGLWLFALGIAVIGTQAAVSAGLIRFADHRLMAPDLPVAAIVLGGLAFGVGMVLTRGCVTRLTVLSGTGNLRALTVLVVFAVTAHAMLKGVLAPLRTTLGSLTLPLGDTVSLAQWPGGAPLWAAAIALPALGVGLTSGLRLRTLLAGLVLGLLVPLAWVGTGYVLFDDFDPIALEGLSFTAPMAEGLFWIIASSAVPATFGTGLVGGVIIGALIAALIGGRIQWQSFETPAQTGRYVLGGVLMGAGGVLAGGCTIGAGLAGVPTLSVAALLAILSITAGGKMAARVTEKSKRVNAPDSEFGGSASTPQVQPAE